jgi:hypothetical protein
MNSVLKGMIRGGVTTQNGALSNAGSGNSVVDYFGKCGTYRNRTEAAVAADMALAWADNPVLTLKTMFYNRAITRKSKDMYEAEAEMTRGQGNKDEFIRTLAWLEKNHPSTLYANLWAIPTFGCWKDLWYDSANTGLHNYVDKKHVYRLIKSAMKHEYHAALLAKYLPKIRSTSAIKNDRHRRLNDFAKGLCKYLGWTERTYRKFKSNPSYTAHQFQRNISAANWTDIDWNMVPGKALFSLTTKAGKDGKTFVQRHGLEKSYIQWLSKQPVAKFTGYPYELFKAYQGNRSNLATKMTLDKQFEGLLEKARTDTNSGLFGKNVLCALDTSASMTWSNFNGVTPYEICLSLGIYFSSLNTGSFKDYVIAFSDASKLVKVSGSTFTEKCDAIAGCGGMGGTNFQSVIDELVRVRLQNQQIPVTEYPQVLLVVSDMQFNPSGSASTNYETAMRKLRAVGLNDMTVIWWNVNGSYSPGNEVPSTLDDAGTVLVSGFDGAIITSILGGVDKKVVDEKTGELRKLNPLEMMEEALNQNLLNKLVVSK